MYIKRLLFILLPFQLFAQTYVKSSDPYKAKNGQVFKVGDTVRLGTPTDFSNIYSYFYQGKDLKTRKEAKGEFMFAGKLQKFDYRFQKFVIKTFYIYEKEGTFAVFDKTFNTMINIDKGLESGELVSKEFEDLIKDRTPLLTDSLTYIEYLKFTKDYSLETVKEFLYLFDNKIYNKVREDEFEFNKQINSTKKKLIEASKELDTTKVWKVTFVDEIGNYDFDKQSFPLLWKHNGLHILSDLWELFTPVDINKNNVQLTDLRIKFSNTNDFSFMPLNEERANNLVKFRKGDNGRVDRTIKMLVYFTVSGMEKGKATPWKDINLNKEGTLILKITRIDFFEDGFPSWNWLCSIKN